MQSIKELQRYDGKMFYWDKYNKLHDCEILMQRFGI